MIEKGNAEPLIKNDNHSILTYTYTLPITVWNMYTNQNMW